MIYTNPQENLLIVGPTGSGKHLFATQRLVNSLADGNSAVVFDCGRSYVGIAKSLGGTLVTVDSALACTVERFGTLPLTVYELENVAEPFAVEALPNLPGLGAATFVLVDEVWQVNRRLPGLWAWLKEALALNFGFCGVMQMMGDVGLSQLPPGIRLQCIKDFAPVDTDSLRPGQLVRHQDGGIYRYHSTARHTDDQTELVVYEHVWPFDAGQLWARPAHEWPSRFQPITNDDLREAQQQNRLDAQTSVTNAKAARRAEETRRKAADDVGYNEVILAPAGSGMSLLSSQNNV
ncbi:DUF1653 domain-containing protein [Burkholderia ubonensis]|uniref:DUF1653 domain-containing protein n=1 Tax=Burkholderia ubonensis TaxID=101571 RepID=UPI0007C86B8F|nr:DUF1653 domain-containing protein [Burkholderia ubonensis]